GAPRFGGRPRYGRVIGRRLAFLSARRDAVLIEARERVAAIDVQPLRRVARIGRVPGIGNGLGVGLGVLGAAHRFGVARQPLDDVRVVLEAVPDAGIGAEIRTPALWHAVDDLEGPRAGLRPAPRGAGLHAEQVVARAAIREPRNRCT